MIVTLMLARMNLSMNLYKGESHRRITQCTVFTCHSRIRSRALGPAAIMSTPNDAYRTPTKSSECWKYVEMEHAVVLSIMAAGIDGNSDVITVI